MSLYELLPRYISLFSGFNEAYGTGKGQWIKRPPGAEEYLAHLEGKGPGLGIGPLRRDGTVSFAAIDLDQPDFKTAAEFQEWIPGQSWVEVSRSGNAHVWVFFDEPIEAWVVTGILQYAIQSAGHKFVEVFPKQSNFGRVNLGNYINLPYYGETRPILRDPGDVEPFQDSWNPDEQAAREASAKQFTVEEFVEAVEDGGKIDPAAWRKRAAWLMITDPAEKREATTASEFGTQRTLHMCAEHVIEGILSGERPVLQGAKSVVYFNLAKQMANCALWSQEEIWEVLQQLADASPDPPNMMEVQRFLRNAYDKQYTSTGCDDPVFGPYAHPKCPIANPRSTR